MVLCNWHGGEVVSVAAPRLQEATPNQALEQTRDSVLRYGESVGRELLNFFVPLLSTPAGRDVETHKKVLGMVCQ